MFDTDNINISSVTNEEIIAEVNRHASEEGTTASDFVQIEDSSQTLLSP